MNRNFDKIEPMEVLSFLNEFALICRVTHPAHGIMLGAVFTCGGDEVTKTFGFS